MSTYLASTGHQATTNINSTAVTVQLRPAAVVFGLVGMSHAHVVETETADTVMGVPPGGRLTRCATTRGTALIKGGWSGDTTTSTGARPDGRGDDGRSS